jgi:hypothetical protein
MKFGIQFPLFDTPDTGSGGGQAAGSGNPGAGGTGATGDGTAGATGTGATGTAAGNTGAGGQAGGQGATGTGQGNQPGNARQFTYTEDRTDWIPRHRFNEVNQRAQRTGTLEQQLQQAQARIQALAGVTPTTPQDAEAEQVRSAFRQMFPDLGKLKGEHIDRLIKLAENGDQIEQTTNHYWQSVSTHMVTEANTQIAEALGVEKLTDTQAKRVGREYAAWLAEDFQAARAEGRAPLLARHEARDPKLVEEFVKQFSDDFIAPAARRANVSEVNRVSRKVPSGRASQNAPINSKPKIDFKNEQAVEDAAVEAFRAHGGLFRR